MTSRQNGVTLTPLALREALGGERAGDQKVRWRPARWRQDRYPHLGDHRAVVDRLEAGCRSSGGVDGELLIGRGDLYDLRDPVEQFVATMIWGFGTVGYGPARVDRMLDGLGFQGIISEIVEASGQNAEDAFSSLFVGGKPRIKGLGIAFGTKFLHAAGHGRTASGPEPLVYDIRVWLALSRLDDGSKEWRSPRGWVSSKEYAAYCKRAVEVADGWNDALTAGERPYEGADVEYALFCLG